MDYPRVTEILKAYTSYDKVPQNILIRASERGTAVHAICASLAKGAWVPDGMIDENFINYVNSFKQWAEKQVLEFVVIEKRYKDEDLGYSGQLDFIIKGKDNKLYLVDLKTSAKPQKTYPIQMAAYENLIRREGIQVEGAMLVYLQKNGEFPDIDYIDEFEKPFKIFTSALECWNYFNRRKNARAA